MERDLKRSTRREQGVGTFWMRAVVRGVCRGTVRGARVGWRICLQDACGRGLFPPTINWASMLAPETTNARENQLWWKRRERAEIGVVGKFETNGSIDIR